MLFISLPGMERSVRAFIYGQKTSAFPIALDALITRSLKMPKPLCPLASAPPGIQMWGASGQGSPSTVYPVAAELAEGAQGSTKLSLTGAAAALQTYRCHVRYRCH